MLNATTTLGKEYPMDPKVNTGNDSYSYIPESRSGVNISVNHKRRHGRFTEGGPWYMRKLTNENIVQRGDYKAYSHSYGYRGGFIVKSHLSSPTLSSNWGTTAGDDAFRQNLANRGAEAWNKLRPDKPDFSIISSVYELKDVPGMLRHALHTIRNRTLRASGRSSLSHAGEYYLAIQFGWLPLYRDIRSFLKAHRGAQHRISQLIRDAGRPVRRTTKLKDETDNYTTTVTENLNSPYSNRLSPIMVTQSYSGGKASTTTTHTYRSQTWAVGVFRYYLPPEPNRVVLSRQLYRRIMGGRLSPSQVYQAIPWSWFVDYFTGLGDFIAAISPGVADRLYAEYAYLMRTVEVETKTEATSYLITGRTKVGSSYVYQTERNMSTRVTRRVQKARVVASPFGWGIKQSSLNTQQLAILGALGFSRLP